MTQSNFVRANIGCGKTPTPGFENFDNSLSVRLAHYPIVSRALGILGIFGKEQQDFIAYARENSILWADAVRHIPLPDRSADLIYASHVIEHFDRSEVKSFLNEVKRVLAPGGVIRIAVPDLRKHIDRYIREGDADALLEGTLLAHARPQSFRERVAKLLVGDRHHLWMYDAGSLCGLLDDCGFRDAKALQPGETTIEHPGSLNLSERAAESLYVEARK